MSFMLILSMAKYIAFASVNGKSMDLNGVLGYLMCLFHEGVLDSPMFGIRCDPYVK